MKEKLMGIIPLIVALMFVVGIGTFSGPSYAATSGPSYAATATQTVTVTVPEAQYRFQM